MEVENFPFSDPFMLLRFERRQVCSALANVNYNNFNFYRAEWKFVRERSLENELHTQTASVWGF